MIKYANSLTKALSFFSVLFFVSCFPSYMAQKQDSVAITESSKFSNVDVLDWSKDELIQKFGSPLNTGAKKEDGVTIEELYYAEVIQGLAVVTCIVIKDGLVTSKSVSEIHPTNDQRLQEIEKQIKILQTPRLYN